MVGTTSLNQYLDISGPYGQELWPVSLMPHMEGMGCTVDYKSHFEFIIIQLCLFAVF